MQAHKEFPDDDDANFEGRQQGLKKELKGLQAKWNVPKHHQIVDGVFKLKLELLFVAPPERRIR